MHPLCIMQCHLGIVWSLHHSITSFYILHSLFSNVEIIIQKEWECSKVDLISPCFPECFPELHSSEKGHVLFPTLSSYETRIPPLI